MELCIKFIKALVTSRLQNFSTFCKRDAIQTRGAKRYRKDILFIYVTSCKEMRRRNEEEWFLFVVWMRACGFQWVVFERLCYCSVIEDIFDIRAQLWRILPGEQKTLGVGRNRQNIIMLSQNENSGMLKSNGSISYNAEK